MSHELTYRIVLAVLAFGYFFLRQFYIRTFHAKQKIHSHHGTWSRFGYVIIYAANYSVMFYIFDMGVKFAQLPLPDAVRWFGAGSMLAAVLLYAWTHHTLGHLWSGVLEISTDHVLRTDGPYQYVRHPMYSAFFLYAIGVLLLSANALIGAIMIAATATMYLARIDAEEQMMLDQFGGQYRDYIQRVDRLLPRMIRP